LIGTSICLNIEVQRRLAVPITATGISLDPKSDEPLYRQLFDQIVSRIRNGTFPSGYRLAPTRTLAKELHAHRNTVVRAYQDLEAAGFVHSTVGRGTFVVAQPPEAEQVSEPRQLPSAEALPWSSLISSAMMVEPLGRSERIARGLHLEGAINLNRLQPSIDLLPHELLRRCLDHVLRTAKARALEYTPREGLPRLRSLVAEDLCRQGVPASAEDLIITTGSQQALDMVARALINSGDPFLVDRSTYAGALNLLAIAGARLIGIPSDDEGPDLAALERHRRTGAKGFYLMPNCQNPTGRRVSVARRHALIRWSHQAGVPLVEDDYASDLNLDGQPPLPALRTLDGEVIYIGTFSKKLIPALRIGYLLCPRSLRPHLSALKHAMDLGTSALLQHALAEFLERGYLRAHLGAVQLEYRRRRDALEAGLAKHLPKQVRWRHPETGLLLWLPTPPSVDPEELFQESKRQGVMVASGTVNSVAGSEESGLRLTFCAEPPARLIEGARRFGKAWAAVERRGRTQGSGVEGARLEVV
jgi:GntR family transcriptional regulator/MocR family aminotransferase